MLTMKKGKCKERKNKGLLRRFAGYYKPHRVLFSIDMTCAFIIAVFNLAYPFVTKLIINNYDPNKLRTQLLTAAGDRVVLDRALIDRLPAGGNQITVELM